MDLLRWIGVTFARFVGLVVLILGGWIAGLNAWLSLVSGDGYDGSVLALVLLTGIAGAVGGVAYLLSFDGPKRFRTQRVRLYGWAGMLISALLPTSLTLMILPMVILVSPLLPWLRVAEEEPATSG